MNILLVDFIVIGAFLVFFLLTRTYLKKILSLIILMLAIVMTIVDMTAATSDQLIRYVSVTIFFFVFVIGTMMYKQMKDV